MKKVEEIGTKKVTPRDLLIYGKTWLNMWENNPTKTQDLFTALYCLFSALEFYLKAYLVLKSSSYANIGELKKIGHNFNKVYEKLVASGTNDLIKVIGKEIKKYNLEDLKLDTLKYPENGQMWHIDRELSKGIHTLGNIFKKIEQEILDTSDEWLITTYPKKTRLSAVTQIEYEGNPEDIDLKELSNLCSKCLPPHVRIFEDYSYPWSDEQIPYRDCVICKELFDPKGMRPGLIS